MNAGDDRHCPDCRAPHVEQEIADHIGDCALCQTSAGPCDKQPEDCGYCDPADHRLCPSHLAEARQEAAEARYERWRDER